MDHVVKYQNNWVSSYLFRNNFFVMVKNNIEVAELLASNVFQFTFDYDEWPSLHTENNKLVRPFNGTIQSLRNSYEEIFPEAKFRSIDFDTENDISTDKIYKIKYSINMIPVLGEYIEIKNGKKHVISN